MGRVKSRRGLSESKASARYFYVLTLPIKSVLRPRLCLSSSAFPFPPPPSLVLILPSLLFLLFNLFLLSWSKQKSSPSLPLTRLPLPRLRSADLVILTSSQLSRLFQRHEHQPQSPLPQTSSSSHPILCSVFSASPVCFAFKRPSVYPFHFH